VCAFSFLSFPFNLVSHSNAWPGMASNNNLRNLNSISVRGHAVA
jgi:hypothetical protein